MCFPATSPVLKASTLPRTILVPTILVPIVVLYKPEAQIYIFRKKAPNRHDYTSRKRTNSSNPSRFLHGYTSSETLMNHNLEGQSKQFHILGKSELIVEGTKQSKVYTPITLSGIIRNQNDAEFENNIEKQ